MSPKTAKDIAAAFLGALWRMPIAIAVVASIFYAFGLFVFQLLFWLRYGEWQALPISIVCRSPSEVGENPLLSLVVRLDCGSTPWLSWLGIEKILDLLASTNLSLGLFLIGGSLWLWLININHSIAERDKAQAQ